MKRGKKILKFWNGRGHGKYERKHMNVAAYSRNQATELLSQACGIRISSSEVRIYYSQCWGNDMAGIKPEHPCVYVCEKMGKPNPQLVINLKPK